MQWTNDLLLGDKTERVVVVAEIDNRMEVLLLFDTLAALAYRLPNTGRETSQ